ncbi:uncharacterized protein [Diabrotica undecimpunctata]|uniref:uncharacterized protein isoform X1 n=1 Tax=Diabrotica undecimpunctata TaxID=50387 RepID=UPI003B634884
MQKTVSQYNRSRGVYCPFKKKSNNDDDVAAGMANSSEFKKSTRKKPSNTKMLSKTDFARNYLHGLPKLEFHYGRKSSNKLYLDPVIRSMCQLYNLYCEFSKSKGIDDVVSWCAISNFFDQMNLSIHPIKKDKCDTCVKDEVGQLDDKDWQKHRARKDRARDEKEQDKINAMKNECKVVTMDLQAVKVNVNQITKFELWDFGNLESEEIRGMQRYSEISGKADLNSEEVINQITQSTRNLETRVVWDNVVGNLNAFPLQQNSSSILNVHREDDNPLSFYKLLLTEDILDLLVTKTNIYAKQQIINGIINETVTRNSFLNNWTDTNKEEVITFLGILIWTGLIQNQD